MKSDIKVQNWRSPPDNSTAALTAAY